MDEVLRTLEALEQSLMAAQEAVTEAWTRVDSLREGRDARGFEGDVGAADGASPDLPAFMRSRIDEG